MKGIITSHLAPNAYQRQAEADPVSVPESQPPTERSVSSISLRAVRAPEAEEEPEPLDEETVVDRAKVERLRRSIEAGSLKFDPQVIAERLVDEGE